MALVKTSKIAAGSTKMGLGPEAPKPITAARPSARALHEGAGQTGTGPSPDQLSERIAAATEELASGLTEASAAAEQLRRSMEQIASGAEEAAGALYLLEATGLSPSTINQFVTVYRSIHPSHAL